MKEKEFKPNVITNLRNCDMSKMHDLFLARVEQIFPNATEKQKTQVMFSAVQIYWMLDGWDIKLQQPSCIIPPNEVKE